MSAVIGGFSPWIVGNGPVSSSLFVDAVNGSDSTGTRGQQFSPYLTIGAAIAAASSGDVVRVGPGTYDLGSGSIRMPDGVALWGSGIDITTIVSSRLITTGSIVAGKSAIFVPGNNFVGGDFTIQGPTSGNTFCGPIGCDMPSGDSLAAKATFYRIRTHAHSDGMYIRPVYASVSKTAWRFFDSIFDSNYDCMQLGNGTGTGSASAIDLTVDFFGCQTNAIAVAGRSNDLNAACNLGAGKFRLHGCSCNVVGVSGSNGIAGFSSSGYGTLEVHGCGLNVTANGVSIVKPIRANLDSAGHSALLINGSTSGIDWSLVDQTALQYSGLKVFGGSPTITTTDPDSGSLNGYLGQHVLYNTGAGGYAEYVCIDPANRTWYQFAAV